VVPCKRLSAANWSSVLHMLLSFAVIRYTENGVYMIFAAAGPRHFGK
jgi:hypothetical protein